ncbi:MAG: oligosaccharide flippase family protein [Burkholderiaceae bacterium]|jgi:O-antigen/teichoic acid export membrane protein|nr:oligosaccharide flippase family protein [Burkholderiaceae bacterium]HMN66759.1 oligosaccharide flippase family protein [Burkholderiaceae bacterium]
MPSVRRSLLLSLADSYLGLVLQLAATVIVSRLLMPAEVGVFAIAAVFAAVAGTVRDFGVGEYLIQERKLSRQHIRAALALNIIVSWGMALLLVAAAPLAADFYREPGVARVMAVQALGLLLVPFGAVIHAWFRRELDYRPIVIGNALSNVASFIATVSLALLGFGYMSLAWSSFVGIVVSVSAIIWLRPKGFPLIPGTKGLGHAFHFGRFAGAVYIVAQIGKGAPELLIGRARGATDVGLFSRAGGLVELFNRLATRPVMQVCMPYFARARRESGSVLPAYLNSVSLLTAVGWPFLGCLVVVAWAAIRIVYGPNWMAAVPLAQVLCLAGAIELLFMPSREALLACGEARRANALQLQIVALQVAGLAAVFPFGPAGACWGLAVAALGGAMLSQWHLGRRIGLRVGELLRACGPSAALTALTVAPLAIASGIRPPDETNYIDWAVFGAAAAALSWLAGLWLLRHPLRDELLALWRRIGRRRQVLP